eukprot:11167064-Lingulodinium_polyedra.AAC.1
MDRAQNKRRGGCTTNYANVSGFYARSSNAGCQAQTALALAWACLTLARARCLPRARFPHPESVGSGASSRA